MTIRTAAQKLKETCATVSARYGIPIVNRRLAVTPIARIADGLDTDGLDADEESQTHSDHGHRDHGRRDHGHIERAEQG
jgi:uncharacterized protein (UPF0210 family)